MKLNDKLLSLVDFFKLYDGKTFYKESDGREKEGFNYYYSILKYRLKECLYQYSIEEWLIPYIESLNGVVSITNFNEFIFNGKNCGISIRNKIEAIYYLRDNNYTFPIGYGGKSLETILYGNKGERNISNLKYDYYELNPITHTLKYDEPDGTTKIYDTEYFFNTLYNQNLPKEFKKVVKTKYRGDYGGYSNIYIDKEDKLYISIYDYRKKTPLLGNGISSLINGIQNGSITLLSYEDKKLYYLLNDNLYIFLNDFGVVEEKLSYIIHNERLILIRNENIEGSDLLTINHRFDDIYFNIGDNIIYSSQLDKRVTIVKSEKENKGYIFYDDGIIRIENVYIKDEEVYVNGVLFTSDYFEQLVKKYKYNFEFFS